MKRTRTAILLAMSWLTSTSRAFQYLCFRGLEQANERSRYKPETASCYYAPREYKDLRATAKAPGSHQDLEVCAKTHGFKAADHKCGRRYGISGTVPTQTTWRCAIRKAAGQNLSLEVLTLTPSRIWSRPLCSILAARKAGTRGLNRGTWQRVQNDRAM